MLRPAGHFKIDRTNKVVAIIEVDFDFFLPILLRQKLFGLVDQCLVVPGAYSPSSIKVTIIPALTS